MGLKILKIPGQNLYKGGVKRRLIPDDYDCVEYIMGDGIAYIDTGIFPLPKYLRLVGKFHLETGYLCGARASTSVSGAGSCTLYGTSKNTLRQDWIGTSQAITVPEDFTINILNREMYINGEKYATTASDKTGTALSSSFIFFGVMTSGEVTPGGEGSKLYSCGLYNEYDDGKLLAQFIPVKKKLTNEYGLYDMVTETFFGNSADAGEFTGGPIVPPPYEYKMLNKEVSE